MRAAACNRSPGAVASPTVARWSPAITTRQNLGYAQSIMDDRGLTEALIVTSDYHVFRASEYAHHIGLKADGVRQPYAWLLLAHGVHPGVHSRYQGAFVAVLCARPAGH